MLVCSVVGARPNFMKMAPVVSQLLRRNVPHLLVHTGQHYDAALSQVFIDELGLPEPDVHMGVGSDTHSRQTARIMMGFEDVCKTNAPSLVVVAGDVNSTLAVSLVAAKENIPVAHVEAGLRSFDRTMPEEINRQLTDHLSELLFTTEASGNENLRREGVPDDRVHFVGNCMVDTLLGHVESAKERCPWDEFGLEQGTYALLTLHRPSNVDDPNVLEGLLDILGRASRSMRVLFPVHPRTKSRLNELGIRLAPSVTVCEPLPYVTFLGLMAGARCVLTDSGGIQEETTVLGVPCLTLRGNTERPVTITSGTNRLVGNDPGEIRRGLEDILSGNWARGTRPPLWDGRAAERIGDVIERWAAGMERQP